MLEKETANGRPISVFLDKWDIDVGENIVRRLEEGLREARFLGVVLSPAMTRAPWPNAEWQSRFFSDPSGKDLRILPMLLHKFDPKTGAPIDIPMFLRPLRRLDFTGRTPREEKKQFKREYAELLRILRGERPRRGSGVVTPGPIMAANDSAAGDRHLPDVVKETLLTNLLPVISHPRTIWSDLTPARTYPEVWKTMRGGSQPPFRLDGGRLFCFFPPGHASNPFKMHLTGQDPRSERPVDWLSDTEKAKMLVGLYNVALREHCYHLRIHTPEKAVRIFKKGKKSAEGEKDKTLKRKATQFYCPLFDGKPRVFRWTSESRGRTLSKVLSRPDGTKFGVHKSARMKFTTIGTEAYLQVEPGWLFTEDGVVPLEGPNVTRFSTLWGGRERNKSVITNIFQWGLLLSQGQRSASIVLGAESLVLQAIPASADISFGIEGDMLDIQRMLGGEGAGEKAGDETEAAEGDEDFESIAEKLFSPTAASEESDVARALDGERETGGWDDVRSGDDDESDQTDDPSDELRLPF